MFFISCMITSEEEPASRFTASITSSQTAHPALNTSTLRLLAISLSLDVGKRRMHLGVYSKVKDGFSPVWQDVPSVGKDFLLCSRRHDARRDLELPRSFDLVVYDLPRLLERLCGCRQCRRVGEPQAVLVVDRHDEPRLPRQVEAVEVVCFGLEDHSAHCTQNLVPARARNASKDFA